MPEPSWMVAAEAVAGAAANARATAANRARFMTCTLTHD
jgi:hypothetical protein